MEYFLSARKSTVYIPAILLSFPALLSFALFVLSGSQAAMFCALAAFIGHIWPLLFKFKGGKGVAVAFGTVLGINWQLALLALGIVALTVLITRMVSMGSVIAAVSFPVISYFLAMEEDGRKM